MKTEKRREVLRSGGRALVAAAIGGLALMLGLRRRGKSTGYCDRAGRCGGCQVTDTCHVHQALTGGRKP